MKRGRTGKKGVVWGDTQPKIIFVAEFRKNTGYTTWEDGSGEETTAKKVITFRGDG